MDIVRKRPFGQNYAFVVVGVVFLALLAAAGMRSAPGVLLQPLEQAFGWSRSVTSFSAGLGIFLYGMVGPFAAALMQTFGIRRTLISALVLMSAATAASALMTEPWHLILTWGVLSGLGTGCVAMVLGATVVNRWFATNRGLIMGIFAASTATGTLIFMPGLAALAEAGGWQPVVLTVAACTAALIPLVFWLLPERPADAGLAPYGRRPGLSPLRQRPAAIRWLRHSGRWLARSANATSGSCSPPSSYAASPPTASSEPISSRYAATTASPRCRPRACWR